MRGEPWQFGQSFVHLLYRNSIYCLAIIALSLSLCGAALAQQATPPDDRNPPDGSNISGAFNPVDSLQFKLCVIVIVFGAAIVAAQVLLLWRIKSLTADDISKNFSITVVIVGATLLIIAGYNSQQTAQAFGLFGTIIGYLLGRSALKQSPPPPVPSEEDK